MFEIIPGGARNRNTEIDAAALYASGNEASNLGLSGRTAFLEEGYEYVRTRNTTGQDGPEYVEGIEYNSSDRLGIDLQAVAQSREEAIEMGMAPNSAAYFEWLVSQRLSTEVSLVHVGVNRSEWSGRVSHNYGYEIVQSQTEAPSGYEDQLEQAA